MINLEEFKKGKIAINTRTQEEYDNLMKFFDSRDITWACNVPATRNDYFDDDKEETCICAGIWRQCKNYYEKEGYKIITPNQLKEYNEFIGKETPLEEEKVFKCGFKAIAWLKENPDREILYTDAYYSKIRLKYDSKYKNYKYRKANIYTEKPFGDWYCVETNWIKMSDILNWREIKVIPKHIEEPKQKTLKEKLEAKETFEYKNNWYRFNKDGAIINSNGGAVSLEFIKDLLTK